MKREIHCKSYAFQMSVHCSVRIHNLLYRRDQNSFFQSYIESIILQKYYTHTICLLLYAPISLFTWMSCSTCTVVQCFRFRISFAQQLDLSISIYYTTTNYYVLLLPLIIMIIIILHTYMYYALYLSKQNILNNNKI